MKWISKSSQSKLPVIGLKIVSYNAALGAQINNQQSFIGQGPFEKQLRAFIQRRSDLAYMYELDEPARSIRFGSWNRWSIFNNEIDELDGIISAMEADLKNCIDAGLKDNSLRCTLNASTYGNTRPPVPTQPILKDPEVQNPSGFRVGAASYGPGEDLVVSLSGTFFAFCQDSPLSPQQTNSDLHEFELVPFAESKEYKSVKFNYPGSAFRVPRGYILFYRNLASGGNHCNDPNPNATAKLMIAHPVYPEKITAKLPLDLKDIPED